MAMTYSWRVQRRHPDAIERTILHPSIGSVGVAWSGPTGVGRHSAARSPEDWLLGGRRRRSSPSFPAEVEVAAAGEAVMLPWLGAADVGGKPPSCGMPKAVRKSSRPISA